MHYLTQQHAGNKHPVQTRKCGMGMHHFPGVPETERLSLCNFRQPCETRPYSAKLYGKFDSLPKGGVDRYYKDYVCWLPLEKKNVRREPLSIFFTMPYFILNVKLFICFIVCVACRENRYGGDIRLCDALIEFFLISKAIKFW